MISYKTIHKQNTIIIITTVTVRVTKRTAIRSTTTKNLISKL
jgi:hypothetical protein